MSLGEAVQPQGGYSAGLKVMPPSLWTVTTRQWRLTLACLRRVKMSVGVSSCPSAGTKVTPRQTILTSPLTGLSGVTLCTTSSVSVRRRRR